ncbi:uncharacterized protein LOC143602316 [Bidens hawaiensis]|uniref:uncharacterized protein LOC143602316 n=1 Tax=Bidens hawaiensis TaxID=980011 RepID=UPI0040495185
MVRKFLKALPRSKYIQIVASLEQVLDLNKTGFEDVVGRIIIPKKFEIGQVENNVWYLDNEASNHMTGNRSFFLELNESITGNVRFGDGLCVKIEGRGSIIFQGKSGEQNLLTETYYVPRLKTNIISLGQATESGCDVRMKDEFLTMYDGG